MSLYAKIFTNFLEHCQIIPIFAKNLSFNMSYSQQAQLEFMNAINSINSESELNEFRNMLARYFAQKAIDALWDKGVINSDTIEEWGEEHMRTPYHYEANRP